jgi:hypothetical protein
VRKWGAKESTVITGKQAGLTTPAVLLYFVIQNEAAGGGSVDTSEGIKKETRTFLPFYLGGCGRKVLGCRLMQRYRRHAKSVS